MADKEMLTPVKLLYAYWPAEDQRMEAGQIIEVSIDTAKAMIAARAKAGLTQAQLASRMGTTQSVVARWESGKSLPSTRTLQSFAKATDTKLCITFC